MSGILSGITQTAQSIRSISTSTADLFGLATQVVGTARTIDNSGNSWSGGEWWQQLQPGSWRGCGFVLDAGQTVAGRRIALHEYPYRDDAWAEDLGKLPRRFMVQGFLVGDDVYQQRDAMLRVVEQSGAGTLVHPTLGSLQCVLMEFATTDRRERGRYVEIQFTFILAGDVQYPATSIASGSAVTSAAAALTAASKGDLGAALSSISIVPQAATAAVSQFAGMATSAISDASQIIGAVRGLPGGYFGRFANGALSTLQAANTTIHGALAAATTTRTAVFSAADSVTRLASLL